VTGLLDPIIYSAPIVARPDDRGFEDRRPAALDGGAIGRYHGRIHTHRPTSRGAIGENATRTNKFIRAERVAEADRASARQVANTDTRIAPVGKYEFSREPSLRRNRRQHIVLKRLLPPISRQPLAATLSKPDRRQDSHRVIAQLIRHTHRDRGEEEADTDISDRTMINKPRPISATIGPKR
jgi:hypothetical protein